MHHPPRRGHRLALSAQDDRVPLFKSHLQAEVKGDIPERYGNSGGRCRKGGREAKSFDSVGEGSSALVSSSSVQPAVRAAFHISEYLVRASEAVRAVALQSSTAVRSSRTILRDLGLTIAHRSSVAVQTITSCFGRALRRRCRGLGTAR